MKNKKGFTLVELLAVIAILAILVIIALPNVMGMFNSAKKSTFITEIKRIYRGVEQEYVKDAFNSSGSRIYSKTKSGCSKELDMSMKDELEYFVEVDSSGKIVKFYAHDNSYQYEHEGYMTINDITDAEDVSTATKKIIITCGGVITRREGYYNLVYDANGGKFLDNVNPTEEFNSETTSLTVTDIEPINTCHTFLGWSTNKNATTNEYSSGETINTNVNSDITLYAIYQEFNDIYVSNTGNDERNIGTRENPLSTINKAYHCSAKTLNITLLSDLESKDYSNFNIANKTINLTSDGNNIYTIKRSNDFKRYNSSLSNIDNDSENTTVQLSKESIIFVNSSKNTVNISNITFDGNNIKTTSPGLVVAYDSTLNLNKGVTIKNFINTTVNKGSGGGISVYYHSVLNTKGGVIITNNKSENQGGGIYICRGTATLEDTTISNNTTNHEEMIYSYNYSGGGIFNWLGNLTINDGTTVSNNKAGGGAGIGVDGGGTFIMNGGIISNNVASERGGGIGLSDTKEGRQSKVIINSGVIKNNETKGPHGGGILITNSQASIFENHGTFSGNTPDDIYSY